MTSGEFNAALAKHRPIEGANLSRVEWTDAQCGDARLIDCIVEDAHLKDASFAGAHLVRCRFIRCRFAHVDFRGATLEDCVFTDKAASTGSIFAFSELREARLLRCDLSFCHFDRCKLFANEMNKCNLLGTRFDHVDFSHAYGRKVTPSKGALRRCNFELAHLAGIRLPECDLSGSIFREADLTDADLTGANLRDCDFEKCELLRAKFAGADLRQAKIAGLNILSLGSIMGLKISQHQQWLLLAALGIEVHPD
jgi:fluoroquinolone resistance protein